jgi:DNA-binding phage protein
MVEPGSEVPKFVVELRRALDRSGLGPAEAARRAGLDRVTIYRYLAGTRRPRGASVRQLSRALGVDLPMPESDPARVRAAVTTDRRLAEHARQIKALENRVRELERRLNDR